MQRRQFITGGLVTMEPFHYPLGLRTFLTLQEYALWISKTKPPNSIVATLCPSRASVAIACVAKHVLMLFMRP